MRTTCRWGAAALAGLALIGLPAESGSWPEGLRVELVSVATDGASGGNGSADSPTVSDDGRYVAFASLATDLAPGPPTARVVNIWVRDRVKGITDQVTRGWDGRPISAPCYFPIITRGGGYVCFTSGAANLVQGFDPRGWFNVFRFDREQGATAPVTVRLSGEPVAHTGDRTFDVSDDGRYIVFGSADAGVVEGDTNDKPDVFLRDMDQGTTVRISLTGAGEQPRFSSSFPTISGDGTRVAFISSSTLLPSVPEADSNVFLRDLPSGALTWISAFPPHRAPRRSRAGGFAPCLDATGSVVAFASFSPWLVPGQGDEHPTSRSDIFLRKVRAERTSLLTPGDFDAALWLRPNLYGSECHRRSMSGDGKRLVIASDDLLPVLGRRARRLLYVVEREAARPTLLLCRSKDGRPAPVEVEFWDFAISGDGNWVVFATDSQKFPGAQKGRKQVYIVRLPRRLRALLDGTPSWRQP